MTLLKNPNITCNTILLIFSSFEKIVVKVLLMLKEFLSSIICYLMSSYKLKGIIGVFKFCKNCLIRPATIEGSVTDKIS